MENITAIESLTCRQLREFIEALDTFAIILNVKQWRIQDFLDGGAGGQPIILVNFFLKLHENGRKKIDGWGVGYLVDLPM